MEFTNQRQAYGRTLVELGKDNKNIVVLDADLGGSTMGKYFEEAYPERHFEMGIAEANMTSVAAGLAQTGKIPFTNSFAVFAGGRAFDQIRQTISIGKLNVKIVGSSSGVSDFGDGATHQCIEDMAIFRAIPNMTVLCPADANETIAATRLIAELSGPCYMRLNRNDYANVTPEGKPFELGKPYCLREGTDIVVFACGVMVGKALEAAELLADRISVRVVNVPTIKPLDHEAVRALTEGCRAIVTAEEHNVMGGLGGAIAEAMADAPKPMKFVGVEDRFGCSGHNYAELLEYLGLTKEHIASAVEEIYNQTK